MYPNPSPRPYRGSRDSLLRRNFFRDNRNSHKTFTRYNDSEELIDLTTIKTNAKLKAELNELFIDINLDKRRNIQLKDTVTGFDDRSQNKDFVINLNKGYVLFGSQMNQKKKSVMVSSHT